MADQILILGASTRAAAQSAARAGLRPICADLFADEDLRGLAEVLPMTGRYPQVLPEVARLGPDCPWMYTGALENHAGIIERISAERPLWGNPADVVRRVRDPLRLCEELRRSGLPAAAVRTGGDPPAPDGRWLLKPLRGAGGRGIVVWDERAGTAPTLAEPHFFQERLHGTPLSAVYVAFPSRTVLMGIARQLTAGGGEGGAPFRYLGSIGPVEPPSAVVTHVAAIGEVLAGTFGLRGLFGCDFIDEGDRVRLTEVNPRYTASVEIHEHALGVSLIDLHRRACEAFLAPPAGDQPAGAPRRQARRAVGKFIVYAERTVRVPPLDAFMRLNDDPRLPSLADIPAAGTRIEAGQPLCTVLAASASVASCEQTLHSRVRALRRAIAESQRST